MRWFNRVDQYLRATRRKKTQNTCYGVEVEVEWKTEEEKNDALCHFNEYGMHNISLTEDGSLRNGAEFVTTIPHIKRSVLAEIRDLYDWLKETNAIITKRCSTHIHMDVRNFNTAQLFAFQTIYSFFEYDMLSCIGVERKNNKFCLTDYVTPINLDFKYGLISGNKPIDWLKERGKRYRYQAMNVIDPILRQGSIEFRSMQGNLDIELLTVWINKLEMLFEISKKFDTPKSMYKLYNILVAHPKLFYKAVFGQPCVNELNYYVLDIARKILGESYNEEDYIGLQ